jgi:hypothetical protein
MGVKIKLSLAFGQLAGNKDKVEVNGSTVRECLNDFMRRFPRTKKWLFNKDGSLSSMVLMNGEVLLSEEVNRPVTEDDELWLLNLLEGG